jgi:hypothetical protein
MCNFTNVEKNDNHPSFIREKMSIDLKIMERELQYRISADSDGNILEGGKNYKLHLPSNIPPNIIWSVIVYDNQTGLMINTDQLWPSVFRSDKGLEINQDGSVDAWFGPKVMEGKEGNWIKTIPAKAFYMILRFYNPLEPWFEKTFCVDYETNISNYS